MTARFFKMVLSSAIVCCAGAILVIGAAAPTRTQFSIWFQGKTLRLDFYHTGTKAEETFSLGHIREEGPWPGSRASLLDGSGLGDYMIVVSDAKSHRALYSHGFDSSFEPQQVATTEIDSVRIPLPRQPVTVIIRLRRSTTGEFRDIWNGVVDPANHSIDRRALEPRAKTRVLVENGSPESKVDIVIIGDGYTEAEINKFWTDAERASGYLFSASPLAENASSFNVRAVFLPSSPW